MPERARRKMHTLDENFCVRPIQKDNVVEEKAVVALVNRCYRSSENWTNESKIAEGLRITLPQLKEALQEYAVLVLENRNTGNIIACLKTGITSETVVGPMSEPTGYIGMFAVSPEYQSQGLGSHLMSVAEKYCKDKGISKMTMDVLTARDDIIMWYERCGYKRTGKSINAAPVMQQKGERLLIPSSFTVLEKELRQCG